MRNRKASIWAVASFLFLFQTFAGTGFGEEARSRKAWKVSLAILTAVHVGDIQSNWGRPEANPILKGGDGRFGLRGVGIKGGILVGSALAEWRLIRQHPGIEKICTYSNFGAAALVGTQAVRNYNAR